MRKAPFECPQDRLRQAQGERTREAPLRRGVGVGMGDGDAPRLAPLDSCLRRNDAVGECGMRRGTETPRAAPLPWVPARAGTTMGGVVGRVGARGWCQGGSPLSRAGGSRTAPTTGVGRTRAGVMRGLLVVEGPFESLGVIGIAKRPYGLGWRSGDHDSRLWWGRPAPLDSCLRRNVAGGGVWGASSRRSPGRTGRHAIHPRPGPRRPGRRGDGRVPPFAAGPPWRPP